MGHADGAVAVDVEYELRERTVLEVKEGFAVCFPQYSDFLEIHGLVPSGLVVPLESDADVLAYTDHCFAQVPAAPVVFVYHLPGDAPAPAPLVDHRETAPLFCRPQHQVALGIYKAVCAQLEEDGKAIGQYTTLKYLILVPKFNSLKQQTKERVEACADLVRESEDSALLVELYPVTSTAAVRMADLMAEIIQSDASGPSDVLYVVIVDECHFAPSSTAVPLLHNPAVRGCKNFVALMVSATPYNCLSTYSRIPEDNIIEWSQHVDLATRPNYIGCEHYFRSVALRLPDTFPAVLLMRVSEHDLVVRVSQFQEFTGCEALSAAIATAANAAIADAFADRKIPRQFQFHCTYGGAAGAGTGSGKVFVFSLKTKAEAVTIRWNNFMGYLGFPRNADVVLSQQTGWVRAATGLPQLGANLSVAKQHLRADSLFSEVYKRIIAACPSLRRLNTKGKTPGNYILVCCH
jgi:hypothetical protein